MTHAPRRDELLDLALGLLEPEQARALEAHADGCEACRVELAALRQTRQLVAGLPPLEAPARGEATLLAAARQAAAAAASGPPRWAAPRWLWGGTLGLAGAAALAVLVLRLSPSPTRLGEAESGPAPAPAPGAVTAAAAPVASEPPARPATPAAPSPPAAPANLSRQDGPATRAEAERAGGAASRGAGASDRLAEALGAVTASKAEASRPPPAKALRAAPAAEAKAAPTAPAAALQVAPAAADAEGPPCRLEQRRRFTRDAAGRVVGRVRAGRYPAAGGEVPLMVEERYAPDGRLLGATVSAGERRLAVGQAEIDAGRLEPLPGVVLARTSGEAVETPPRCEP